MSWQVYIQRNKMSREQAEGDATSGAKAPANGSRLTATIDNTPSERTDQTFAISPLMDFPEALSTVFLFLFQKTEYNNRREAECYSKVRH